MNIQIVEQTKEKVMKIDGRIDTATAPWFESRLLELLENSFRIRIDLEKVVYVSSAGLRAFLNGQKLANKNGVSMIICNVADTVMEVFEITGFVDILTIE